MAKIKFKKSLKIVLIGLYVLISLKCMLLALDQELSVIYSQRTPTPPPKPLNISKNAVWHGGLDGGSWYDCHKTKVAYEVHCTVYGEGGNVWVKDDFEMYATQMYEPYKNSL